MLQWGRTLSSAEVNIDYSVKPNLQWLQWGRTLSSAEVDPSPVSLRVSSSASMGPHSFKCGSIKETKRIRRMPKGFNGAALFQVRKFQLGTRTATQVPMLQWGRTLSSAEVKKRRFRPVYCGIGFNGAALFQVRKSKAKSGKQLCHPRFNGAALFQVRKYRETGRHPPSTASLQWGRTLSSAEVSLIAAF